MGRGAAACTAGDGFEVDAAVIATVVTMRVLCSFVGGAGHLVPQLPLHRSLVDAGHSLTLVGRASAMRAAPAGVYDRIVSHPDPRTSPARGIAPLVSVDIEHELRVVEQHFAGPAARRSAAAVAVELPDADLLVCDELDFGAIAAAQRAGVPVVVVAVIASGALVRPDRLTDALDRLRRDLDVRAPIRLFGDAFVVPFAPAMRDPAFPPPAETLWMRPEAGDAPHPDGSVVATLGTEFNTESGDLFERIIAALAATGRPAVVAVGQDLDPARFGEQARGVQVERFVDLGSLIPRASVVVHHGGSGLFVRSVLGGAPQVVFPMGADQPFTAQRVADLGLGRVLDPMSASAEEIAGTIDALLVDERARENTSALRLVTAQLPTPAEAVAEIESVFR